MAWHPSTRHNESVSVRRGALGKANVGDIRINVAAALGYKLPFHSCCKARRLCFNAPGLTGAVSFPV